MRIGIREQLAAVVLLAVLISLGIVSIPTWLFVNNFVGDVKTQALALTASLKAAQIASVLDQLRVISNSITTRGLIQDSLRQYYTGNVNTTNWAAAVSIPFLLPVPVPAPVTRIPPCLRRLEMV